MKEIRLHGRGGLGVVKASQLVVRAAVEGGLYGQSIPAFGVERKGSPCLDTCVCPIHPSVAACRSIHQISF